MTFDAPMQLAVAAALVGSAAVLLRVRRAAPSRPTLALFAGGATLLAVAAGEPVWHRPAVGRVAVLVDLSPSTRGATFRDRAALDRRLSQLLGDVPFDRYAFADGRLVPLPPGPTLPDLPADRTELPPSSADAVVLFTDGRFPLPDRGPPTYPVIDPALDDAADAAVTDLVVENGTAAATVRLAGPPRTLTWSDAGQAAVTRSTTVIRPAAVPVAATLSPGDLWPENDGLTAEPPPPAAAQRWWVGASPPPGWTYFDPAALPTDAAAYLAPAVVVLSNVSADDVSPAAQRRLAEYARDLGGGVVIVGGDRAFAAGGYGGTPLDAISPLASDPPGPAERWVLLIDGSGSMATADAGGPTRWQTEIAAVAAVLLELPPADTVDLGSFAAGVTWWSRGSTPSQVRLIPPTDPNGATDLRGAVAALATGDGPAVAVLMTDAEADPPDVPATVAALSAHHVRLDVLAVGDGAALPALRSIAAATGGSVVRQLDAAQWVVAARQLVRAARPQRYRRDPLTGHWTDGRPLSVPAWNQTWAKPTATVVAAAESPLVARWNVGLGHVVAAAFPADPATAVSLADEVAAPPHDPRYTVTWTAAGVLHVAVDAVDGDTYLNGRSVRLSIAGAEHDVPQSAPGQYEADVPAPRTPAVATVSVDGRPVERFAVAGRYPPEFDVIGNDRAALAELAARTGGAVVPPGPATPIDFRWPTRRTPLTPAAALAAFVLLCAGLVRWRRVGR